jgi:hypothetical protein
MMQPVVNKAVTSCFTRIFPCWFRTQSEPDIVIKSDPIALQIIQNHTKDTNQI